MIFMRLLFLAIVVATAAMLLALMLQVLAPGGWTLIKALIFLAFLGVVPWVGICVGNALFGFAVLMLMADPPRAVLPVVGDIIDDGITVGAIVTKVAVIVTVRNEPIDRVLPALQALLAELDPAWFQGFVLSDTQDAVLAAAEQAAVPAAIFYRRRTDNAGFKAGNVMDFLDRQADAYPFTLMLDADSVMTPDAVRRLVRIMQTDPEMGIVQHLTVGLPATTAFTRLFQFGMRAGMRVWATGQALWQGADGPYWGHNAILRSAAFRDHCKLPLLPGGRAILSHDQVEAAMLRAAGYKVCVWADEAGSLEATPPALPEFLARDSRWLAGNLEYRHLLRAPGFAAMGRWQLLQAMLLFSGAPLCLAILLLASLSAATGGGAQTPREALLALTLAWTLAVYLPKLLGYLEVLCKPSLRRCYGGGWQFARGVLAETIFTLLLDALATPHKTFAMLRLAFGAGAGWSPQNRRDRAVDWAEATRLFWPHTLIGLLAFAGLAASSWLMMLWAIPYALGMVLAIPFTVLSANPGCSNWLRMRAIAATPEELRGEFTANVAPRG